MRLSLRFFATFREAVGRKEIEREFSDGATVGDVLAAVEEEYPELAGDILDEEGDILPQLSVLKNGREVAHEAGTATELGDGDRLSVFPPVAGGGGNGRKTEDGAATEGTASDEAAAAEPTSDEATTAEPAADETGSADARESEERVERRKSYRGISERLALEYLENLGGERVDEAAVAGEGWRAETDAEKVAIGSSSLELTEVTVTFAGEAATVEEVVERFSRKAMRAGG